jgi:hypothetical protein
MLGAALALGCGGGQTEPVSDANGTATATATAAPTPTATSEPVATAEATASAPTATETATASATVAKGKRTFKFEGYTGPKASKSFANTPLAWVVRPAGDDGSFENNRLDILPFLKVQGDEVIVQMGKDELIVPQAIAHPAAAPAALQSGDIVLTNTSGGVTIAKVAANDKKTGQTKVKYVKDGAISETTISRQATLKLDGTLSFGAPVAFKDGATWVGGWYGGGDASKGFVAMGKGWKVVDAKALKALKIGTLHAAGAAVWTKTSKGFEPGTVEEALDDGLRYKVKLKSGSTTAAFDAVSAPLE